MHTIENGTPARIMVMYVSAMQIKYGFPKKKKKGQGGCQMLHHKHRMHEATLHEP